LFSLLTNYLRLGCARKTLDRKQDEACFDLSKVAEAKKFQILYRREDSRKMAASAILLTEEKKKNTKAMMKQYDGPLANAARGGACFES